MSTLASFQGDWHRAMDPEADLKVFARRLGVDEGRLRLYREFVLGHLDRILDTIYTRLSRILPPEQWKSLGRDYFRNHPSTHPELNEIVRAFPDFLRKRAKKSRDIRSEWVELAEWEWLEFELHVLPEWKLKTKKPKPGFALNPILRLLRFEHQIVDWVNQIDALDENVGQIQLRPKVGIQVAACVRDRSFNGVGFIALDAAAQAIALELQNGKEIQKDKLIQKLTQRYPGAGSRRAWQKKIRQLSEDSILLDQGERQRILNLVV